MVKFPNYLIEGHKVFLNNKYLPHKETYEHLADAGQNPEVLVIGCSDSRVNPNDIFNSAPGQLFIIRNVANLVPPFETLGAYHGVSAALEFGIQHLEIKHVVVLGHTGCGGVKAMLDTTAPFRSDMTFINNWVSMMSDERDEVLKALPKASLADQMEALEQRSITASLNNLRSFPFVKKREDAGQLALHGTYFDVASGSLFVRDPESGVFSVIK